MTRITKRYRAQKNFMFLLHFLIPIMAAISLIVIGFITGTKKTSTSIVASMMIAAILLMINVVKKVKLTCIPYIILIGAYWAIPNIEQVIYIIAAYTILDDFVFRGAYYNAKTKYLASRVDDKREVVNNAGK